MSQKLIGEIIKELRLKTGFTQKELAKKANISCSFLCDIEKCRANPAIITLQKIANVLNISDFNIFLNNNYVNIEKINCD